MAMGIDEIEFYFSPFTGIEDPRNRNTIFLAFGFENQEDPGLAEWFGELEGRRQSIDKIPIKSDEDVVSLQTILREGKTHHAGLIYARYPWKKKKEIVLGDINFLREIFCNTILAVGRVKNEKHTALCIILPDKFSPRNIKDEEQRGHLYQFVKTVTEAIVYANEPYVDFKTDVGSKIKEVFFLFFGEPQKALDEFLRKAIVDGKITGNWMAIVRRLTETPPNIQTPLELAAEVLGKKIGTVHSGRWRKIGGSKRIVAHILSGTKTLRAHGFNLTATVNDGSEHEPCILKLHYIPKTNRQKRIRKVVLTGKGVVFDTGGHDLKGTGFYDRMHYDMAAAATVLAIPFLAEEFNLPVEIIAIAPMVQNMLGPKAVLPHSIIRAYGGKTVEITNTDAEGRLILAEAIAFGDEKFKPDALITVGTLSDMSGFGPDFLKVGFSGNENERRIKVAEKLSAEKVLMLPRLEYLNRVDEIHDSPHADIINDLGNTAYHTSPFVFLSNFFKYETSWIFVDNSAVFESDAHAYGAGPGFGLKFVWHLVKQFS